MVVIDNGVNNDGDFILPGITNSGISFRTSDLLRNILLGFDRRSDVGVGVECFL
jgi:hypothetical protein